MPTSLKVPKALADKFSAITVLADAFGNKHLNNEYLRLIHQAIGELARKRPLAELPKMVDMSQCRLCSNYVTN